MNKHWLQPPSYWAWLPSLFTSLSMMGGFYAITLALEGSISAAVHVIMLSMLFDFLDGWIARKTGTESQFGKEYDSLCDLVAFGLAPALTVYQLLVWSSIFAWLIPAIYSCAVAIRLARFNAAETAFSHFEGLPCTAGGPFLLLLCYYLQHSPMASGLLSICSLLIGLLMNAKIPYRSLKRRQQRAFTTTCVLVVGLMLVLLPLLSVLLILLCMYIISPLLIIPSVLRFRRSRSIQSHL